MTLGKKFCFVIFSLIGLTSNVAVACEHGKHYQDLNDCRKYTFCNHGVILYLSCDEGRYWNSNINSCDFESNVICSVVTPPTTPKPSPPTTPKPTPPTTPKATTSTTPVTPFNKCKDYCGRSAGSRHICPQFDLGMEWSFAGEITGKYCTHIVESDDPEHWQDNFLCFNNYYGIRWSSAGAIDGMNCAKIREDFTWNDQFLCVPYYVPFQLNWSSSSSPDSCCVRINEASDPFTWRDNYLCVNEKIIKIPEIILKPF